MKHALLFIVIVLSLTGFSPAQAVETFDIATFKQPKGWNKQASQDAILFSTADKENYCLITLYRSVPGLGGPNENFDAAWSTIVKEAVTVSAAPQMFPSDTKGEWLIAGGFAPFEMNGEKGVAVLYTASGYGRMVNALVLTNTQAYEAAANAFLESISFKKPAVENQLKNVQKNPAKETVIQPAPRVTNSAFKFTTTNFDDGWTSIEQEDWVEVTKGSMRVLLHYPKQGTIFPADPGPLTNAAWDILVAPRYSNLKNYKTAYITTSNRPYLGMGYATEKATGKNVFIVLFRQGNTGWLEFVAPDKSSFIQQYKFDPETIRWDSDSDLMTPLINMTSYNRFGVAASDFKGKWTSDFTGIQQLYSVYTGEYAGMNMNQSNEEFIFTGNTYNWKLLVVSGMVGTAKYTEVKSAGQFSVPNNWQVHFTRIENRARTYHAFWSCIKGARVLNLLDANALGSGIYTKYGLAK